jgi:hypothetical protein
MKRLSTHVVIALAAGALMTATDRVEAQQAWSTIKGRIVWGGGATRPLPDQLPVGANAACLAANRGANAAKGTIPDESVLVHRRDLGFKNVFVWLISNNSFPVNPKMPKFPPQVEVDQPSCMFWPRAIALHQGQVLVVKNTSDMQHNVRYIGKNNPGASITLAPRGPTQIKGLVAERLPMVVVCDIHGWMKGRIAVFDHPYFAITDDNGNFEIPNAPVGQFAIMIYHETFGYRLGKDSRDGEPINIKGAVTDLGNLKMGK